MTFSAGNTPWNRGVSKKDSGRRSYRVAPLGSERLNTNGYLVRKVSDTGTEATDSRPVHKLLWESVHGAVPAGQIVSFRDGNRENIALDNLHLLTRAQIMHRNNLRNLPPELQEVIRLKQLITRKVHEHDR
ncbi:TPA: HNH endonuclease signature motif containing protein [Burkholderia cepacia]|uniref:HNH endonuclease signature motif containing protein n=1 Tax=Burkholderia cepacia TaxID=292 RepID=UPI001CF27223|nr:HNH endonuclease signature motif containing protein [Burkholderia cepacia]MCA8363168.1 HNH endonuclease [Burkholderia cepacia]HDR9756476.1 HNH endonuclease [Burkholderia cepacia ATCC 25416]HDV6364691.1 HNH endonuclease [Burkholderia cepacia]